MAYAWTRITFGDDRKNIQPGDEVSVSDLDSQEEYDTLLAERVIRDQPYPAVEQGESVKTALLRMANEDYQAALAGDPSPHDATGRAVQANTGDDADKQDENKQSWRK